MPDYPQDEFDELASAHGPTGVHRPKKGVLGKIIAPFLIFLLAGVAAYGVSTYLWQQSGGTGLPPQGPQATPTITKTVIDGPDDTVSPSATVSPSDSVAPEPVVDLATPVVVLNGAGVSGLAGRQQAELEANGFTAVTSGNLTGAKPAGNTVRYADPTQAGTAARVGEVLGVSAIEQGTTSGGGIDVLLVTDPDA